MGKSKNTNTDENKIVELEEMNIILRIPKSAASVTVNAVLIDENDKTVKVSRRLSAEDIRSARQDFLDNVENGDDYDAHYVLTDEGREYLEQLKAGDAYE